MSKAEVSLKHVETDLILASVPISVYFIDKYKEAYRLTYLRESSISFCKLAPVKIFSGKIQTHKQTINKVIKNLKGTALHSKTKKNNL